jgi:tetratricopeptide (TPR) repeat protein
MPSMPRYEILGELGRGGMGAVYKARDMQLNRLVALKVILAGEHADAQDRDRFRAEAEAAASLQHPHIVQIYEIGEHQGRPFLSLEFCPGGSLKEQLGGRPLAPDTAAHIAEALARGAHAAHLKQIVHRDLKPANILLAEDGSPRIADFGLAKRLDADSERTATGAILGTPAYMAPEQAAGRIREIGPAADIYALGAILYELLTGRPPFRGDSHAAVLDQVREHEPSSPRLLNPAVPRDLATVCLKCLEKDPARRYPSAEALADDLARCRAGEPILARPPGRLERSWRWARRHRLALLGSGLVLASALILFFFWRIGHLGEQLERGQQSVQKVSAERDRLLAEIAEARAHLQALEGRAGQHRQAANGVAELGQKAPGPEGKDPQARPLVERLQGLLAQFESKRGPGQLSAREDLELRKSRAALANAEGDYARAERLITDDDVKAARSDTESGKRAKAALYEIRANSLSGRRDWPRALACYGHAVALYAPLVKEGRDELRPDLARILISRGKAYHARGAERQALADFEESAALLAPLVRKAGRTELVPLLARSLTNRGNVQAAVGDYKASVAAHDEAVALYASAGSGKDGASRVPDSWILTSRAYSLFHLGRSDAARSDLDHAVALLEKRRVQRDSPGLKRILADTLEQRAAVLRELGKHAEQVRDLGATMSLAAELGRGKDAREAERWRADLACERGQVLIRLGRNKEGLADFEDAIQTCRRMLRAEQDPRTEAVLAHGLYCRGRTRRSQGNPKAALPDLDEAHAILKRLRAEEDRPALAALHGHTQMHRGLIHLAAGEARQGLKDFSDAIQLLTPLSAGTTAREAAAARARALAYGYRGSCELRLRRPDEALQDYARAIKLLTPLLARPDSTHMATDFAAFVQDRGSCYLEQKKFPEAEAAFRESVARFRKLDAAGSLGKMRDRLARGLYGHALAWEGLGKLDQARTALDAALGVLRDLVEREGQKHLAGFLRHCLELRQRFEKGEKGASGG